MNFEEAKKIVNAAIRDNAIGLNLSSQNDEERLSDTDIRKLSVDIVSNLKSLKKLDLSWNSVTNISFIRELKNLETLYLHFNNIDNISLLNELQFLLILDLGNNRIEDASVIKELTSLTSLSLRRNPISDFTFVKNFKFLTYLDLSNDTIGNLSYLKELKSLKELELWNNPIEDATFIGELKSLTSLKLINNRINNISFIKNLNKLSSLWLAANPVEDLTILQELKLLTTLYLSHNHLNDVSFIKELKSLTTLFLSNNQINDASFVKELKSLTKLDLSKNPNLNLPKNLKDKVLLEKDDIDEIVKYYEQLESEGNDYIYEAKTLIVGEPKAGKTTLFRKLQNPEYLPQEATQEEKESTIGVDIEILEFPFDAEKNFKAHLWDFGGQEKQYVLHQYFFTERSLYVLLADDRKELGNFNYWFEIIATLGSGCPVLVVLNEINSKVKNFDISVYKKEFGEKVRDIEEKSVNFADNADGRFANLANEIKTKLKNLEHIGQALPKTWVKVRRELGEIKQPIISIDDYNEICKKSGVKKPEYRRQILEYLHDLGIALNYKYDDNLRNKLILRPNWVIDALYVVLKDENINNNAGKFSSDEVFDLWNDYKAEEKTILLQLMQKGKFEVAYKLEGKNEYIAPILLPEIAPEYDFDETNALQIIFDYTFKPKGIISRLIVRFHENIVWQNGKQIVWKKGVLLKSENSVARIIESEQFRKITITVSGKNPVDNREFITVISNEIKRIHQDWFEDRLEFKELIPCYCDVCKKSNEPQFYELKTVKNYYKSNLELTCDKSVNAGNPQRVNARRLLEGVYVEDKNVEQMFFDKREFNIANLNITNISGSDNKVFQGLNNAQIILQEKIVDEISSKMNETQSQMLEDLSNKILSRIEEAFSKLGKETDDLEEAKKGKWETKLKFTLPFLPFEISRTITPNEFIEKVRQVAYGDDMQLNILEAKEETKGFLGQ